MQNLHREERKKNMHNLHREWENSKLPYQEVRGVSEKGQFWNLFLKPVKLLLMLLKGTLVLGSETTPPPPLPVNSLFFPSEIHDKITAKLCNDSFGLEMTPPPPPLWNFSKFGSTSVPLVET